MAVQDWYLKVADGLGWRWSVLAQRLEPVLGARSEEWVRLVMDRTTEDWVRQLPVIDLDAVEISGQKWRDFGFRSYRSLDFPEFDVCAGPLSPESFDIVIIEQVLEHVLTPQRALHSIWQMLRPGGYALVTTPFLVKVHHCPVDCSRWTRLGLQHALVEAGFPLATIRTASWGNRLCFGASYRRVPKYIPWLHSLRNDDLHPQVVWALARKQS